MGKYTLYVDDNFHYLDADARRAFGEFDPEDDATRAARMIVDDFLRDAYRIGMTPEELLACYKAYGEEPWLSGSAFSAWTYAEQRCWEMCVG
jgi:hypothetical protein